MKALWFSAGVLIGALVLGLVSASNASPGETALKRQLAQEREYSKLAEERVKQANWEVAQLRLAVRDIKGDIK